MGGNAFASDCLFVDPSPCLSNRLTFGLDFRMCVGHYHGLQGIETEGHRLELGLASRRTRSDLDPRTRHFSSFQYGGSP